MKSRIPTIAVACVIAVLGLTVWSGARSGAGKKTEPVKGKMPALKIDNSPVAEGARPGVVITYADVLDAIRPAVVSVYSKTIIQQQTFGRIGQFIVPGPVQPREQKGLGSGVIVSPDGYILTNNHVVADADEIEVALNDGRKLPATVVGKDPRTDIAVIKIDSTDLPAATLGESDKLRVGDVVFAIGNPLDVGQTVTMGIISATSRRVGILQEVGGYEDFIQTDASINQGNSGGALIDAKGRVIGINSAILSNSSAGNIGIGFAIPIRLASSIMRSLIERGTVSRGYLGVATDPLTPELAEAFGLKKDTKGVVVTDLAPPDGPAGKAGIKQEDVIVAIDGRPVASRDDLRLMIAEIPPGTKVAVKVLRDGKPKTIEATLDQNPNDEGVVGNNLIEGVTISPLTSELRRELRIDNRVNGVVITDVTDKSPYREIFQEGAVIEAINRVPVTDLASARKAVVKGRNFALVFYRGGRRYVQFEVK
jgi:serine protease Do/serine protease DegQ